jgi:hypothetical protein
LTLLCLPLYAAGVVFVHVRVELTVGHDEVDDSRVEFFAGMAENRLRCFEFLHVGQLPIQSFNALANFNFSRIRSKRLRCFFKYTITTTNNFCLLNLSDAFTLAASVSNSSKTVVLYFDSCPSF